MARASKIQDVAEVKRWLDEGRTYAWMAEEYLRKYNIEVSPSTFSQLRSRMGWERRHARNDELIPWAVKPEHRWAYAVQMLRAEGRRRQGFEQAELASVRLKTWLQTLEDSNAVVHYEPDTDVGWFYVPRTDEDTDIIRKPKSKTTERHAVE